MIYNRLGIYFCDYHFSIQKKNCINLDKASRILPRWYNENRLMDFGVAQEDVLRAYFLAAASIYEPSRATERLAWARVAILANTISTHLHNNSSFRECLERSLHCPYEERDGSG